MTTTAQEPVPVSRADPAHPGYKWLALSNTTLGVLMATMNSSIVLISLPAIFRGIGINPLEPGNISYLLWMIMGYMLVTAVLVVTLGRFGDMYGRAKIYNAGFAVFTVASIALALDPFSGGGGALWLILVRVVQGIGGAMLMANATAILTDAFPAERRGFAIGTNSVAAIGGSFIGLLVGGVLSEVDWRLVFWVSVPFGVLGTIWAYKTLRDPAGRREHKIDWWGNLTFGVGLILLLVGVIYAIQPYGGHAEGWTNPFVLGCLIGGVVVLAIFCVVETKVDQPMFHLELFRIRAFTSGLVATLMSALSRGGLQFMLIIWLQGIWLPLHGYDYEQTPLWSAIYMLPLTVGFLISAPISGVLSDRFGARLFATGGLVIVALTFVGLLVLPTDFNYWWFAAILFVNGVGSGLFISPNMTGIMNSLPADQRGAGSGMMSTLQNSGMALSIGIFFSMLIAGLASSMPAALLGGLTAQNVPLPVAQQVAALPPVGTLFAAFLGYNPMAEILGPQVLGALPPGNAATLVGKQFFPNLVTGAFHDGLVVVFAVAIAVSLVGAIASLFRGGKYVHGQDAVEPAEGDPAGPALPAPTVSHAAPAAVDTDDTADTAEFATAGAPATPRGSDASSLSSGDRNTTGSAAVLTGRVTTAEGRPVGATLTATDASGRQLGRARADSEGAFTLRARPGTALLICSAPGHAPRAETLTIGVGGTRHDVVLESTTRGARTPVAGS
ncbi:MFS transporter [Actinomycetospora chiangmaiensis]|uniref:MFS transporter n=1 Tax=Actinomycetospora chiangmaiensis TaxID=402650 RepID=UPI00035C5671|nr:MFS transporter [Actinomycetospora chiangmaiensis]